MSQFNNQFRLFFKKLTDIAGKPLASSQTRIKSYTVKRDLLTKCTSSFTILETPNAIEVGDIVGMYDSYGTIVYLGIVSEINDNIITSQQTYELFNDLWLWNNPRQSSLEETIKTIITNDYQNNRDTLMQQIYGDFEINTTSNTNLSLQSQEPHYTVNFASFLYDIYEKYNIIVDIEIPFNDETPIINIGTPNYNKIKIGNNAYVFRNFNITTDVFETNKLVVYSEETGAYRGSWFTTSSGITDNPSALNRIPKIKTNIQFSDDDISILKASSLRNEIYNHRIECDLVIQNKLLLFEDLRLGQECDLYYNGDYYSTILTGYNISMTDGIESDAAKLTFGLVRTSLTSKLYKRLNK